MTDPQKLQPEEYLDRYGISAHLKDIVALLLENRPQNPVEFVSEYFRNANHGSSPIMRSYHYIRLTTQSRSAFMHNLVSSYTALQSKSGSVGLTGADFSKLVKTLCYDFPSEHIESILFAFQKQEDEILSFSEFVSGVRVCLMFEEFLSKSEELFRSMDPENTGAVQASRLIDALKRLSINSAGRYMRDGIMQIYNTHSETPAMAAYHHILMGVIAKEEEDSTAGDADYDEGARKYQPPDDGLMKAIMELAKNKEESADRVLVTRSEFTSCVFNVASLQSAGS